MIFDVKTVRPLALAAAVIGLAIPAVMFVPGKAEAQSASITVRTGPAYAHDYGYADRYYEPAYGADYYYADEPVVVDRVYAYDRDNLRTDRRSRRFIDKEREEGRR